MYRPILLSLFLISLGLQPTAAQQPTSEQRDAIRASCRSDFMANCSGVEPGGKAAFECLQRSHDRLSTSCKTAVDAVAAKTAPAAAETPATAPASAAPPNVPVAPQTASSQEEQLQAVRRVCTLDDIAAHCSFIAPTSPELVLCLKANAADLSPSCKSTVTGLAAPKAATTVPAEPAPPIEPAKKPPPRAKTTTAAPAAAAPGGGAAAATPTADQKAAIRSACRSDFMAHCSGVQPGGSAALQCLAGNSAKLSSACRTAVAAISGGGAGGAVAPASATPAAAPAAVPPLTPRPVIMPEKGLLILRICRADAAALCAGTPPGGGRLIDCLGANAASLSPACYDAVARVSH